MILLTGEGFLIQRHKYKLHWSISFIWYTWVVFLYKGL